LNPGSQETLDFVKKGITLEQSRNAVRWAKNAGMEIRGSFIIGMPGDTPEKAESTIRFACELNVDWLIFFPYHVQRGTYLGDIAHNHGTVSEQSTDAYTPSYVPVAFENAAHLTRILKQANRRYYLRPKYICRTLWRMRNLYVAKNIALAFFYWFTIVFRRK
jgi:anaerobic magnesium-protoporphyrin IX monomethyl ester cyclase